MPQKNQSSTQNRSNRKGSSNSKVKRARRRNNKKTRAARKETIVRTQQKFALSKCSDLYLKCLTNPFDASISDACVPDLLDLPSAKYRVLARGTAVAGTAGVAFLAASARAAAINDQNAFSFSEATFGGVTVDMGAIGTQYSQMAQSPYAGAAIGVFPSEIQYRVVGFGIRMRYTGTELNRGGRIIISRGPNNDTSFNNFTAGDLLALRTSITAPMTRRWHSVAFLSTNQFDTEFRGTGTTVDATGAIAIFADGMVAGQGFEWEAVGHFEYIGTLTNVTRSHTDLPGLSAVRDAVNATAEVQEPGPGWFTRSLDWVTNKGVSEMSGPALKLGGDLLRKQLGV